MKGLLHHIQCSDSLNIKNSYGRDELVSLFAGCKALKIRRYIHALIGSHVEEFGFSGVRLPLSA